MLQLALLLTGCVAHPTTAPPPWTPERRWVDVNTYPCAVDDAGQVECWHRENSIHQEVQLRASEGRIVTLSPAYGSGVLTGLTDAGDVQVLSCPNSALGNRPRACDYAWTPPLREQDREYGIGDDGRLQAPGIDWLPPPEGIWLAMSHGTSLALNARFEVADVLDRFPPLVVPLEASPVSMAGGIVTPEDFPVMGACVLDTEGRILCVGDPWFTEVPFAGQPGFRDLRGGGGPMCALRDADDRILCDDGSTYDFGPIRTYSVFKESTYDTDGTYQRWTPGSEPTVCAITEANTIVCEGPGFDEAIQAQLDEVNALYGDPDAR